ncbi:MAG: type II toxin-antitoxin system HicA family toxin [Caldilineaceae bacterium]
MNKRKLLEKILRSPHNVSFSDLTLLAEAFGFVLSRTTGSHHIYSHPTTPKLLNLQNQKGKAKPYQVRQFLKLIEEYNLTLEE